jgi:hypothetical protein
MKIPCDSNLISLKKIEFISHFSLIYIKTMPNCRPATQASGTGSAGRTGCETAGFQLKNPYFLH